MNCIVCGRPNAEIHHIIFRSQEKSMVHIKINLIPLCAEHHRGDKGPHKNRKIDLKYKVQLQEKLFDLLSDYETKESLANKLETNEKTAAKILKTIPPFPKCRYKREDIIRAMLGGKLY